MATVVWQLAIIGGQLSDDADEAFRQMEELNHLIRRIGGVPVGPWKYHFQTVEQAKYLESALRRFGITFERTEVIAVDGDSGNPWSRDASRAAR